MTEDQIRERTLKVVNDYQVLIRQKRMQEWGDLWHDEGVLEFPFAPDGRQQAYRGKAVVVALMTEFMGRAELAELRYFKVHPLLNPECVMVEAGTRARFIITGRPYNQTYVFYFETREGKIWRYREYWNASTLIDAFGGRDVWMSTWGRPDENPRQRPFLTD